MPRRPPARAPKSPQSKPQPKSRPKPAPRRDRRGVDVAGIRRAALALPGAAEGTSYGTPCWRVRGKLFARVHDSGEALVVKIDLDEREHAMAADPETFFITDHYLGYPYMLVRLARITPEGLAEVVGASWRRAASKRLVDAFDAAASAGTAS